MNKTVIIVVLLFVSMITFSQEKEWQNLTNLLNKEAVYFQGKSGFIQLSQNEYNVFYIEKMSVSAEKMVAAMGMKDRFDNTGSERYLEETLVFDFISEALIVSCAIDYDYPFYFESFPEAQFLRIEFAENNQLIHHIKSVYKDLKTGKEDKTIMEERSREMIIPIRKRNREKILKAVDAFQVQTLKNHLDSDRTH